MGLHSHSLQFQQDTPSGRWRWTTLAVLSGVTDPYQITEIVTPFGPLRDSIPIPGDVLLAMAASVETLQQQFPPSILVGPPTSLTFEVDEGRGFSSAQVAQVTNDGVYGSVLNVALATSTEDVRVSPASLSAILSNEVGEFEVSVDSTNLTEADSPVAATVTMTDGKATNSPQTLPVTIVVRPKAEIDVSPTTLDYTVTKPLTGSFPVIPSQAFVVSNIGPAGSVLDFQVQRLLGSDTWLKTFSPISGTLNAGETQAVTVVLEPDSSITSGTVLTETLRVSGYSSNDYVDVTVTLTVN